MRLFVAINWGIETRERFIALREELRSHSQRGNFSLDENLHLTLVFLGECDTKQIAAAKAAMNAVRFEPFNAVIDRMGRFRRDGGDTWWAGLRGDKPLMILQQELSDRLREAGFKLENRKYSPHVTLGREVVTNYAIGKIEPFVETVTGFELMKSERIGGKLTYMAISEKR